MTAKAKSLNSSGSLFEVRTKNTDTKVTLFWLQLKPTTEFDAVSQIVKNFILNPSSHLCITHCYPNEVCLREKETRKWRKFLPFLFFVCWSFFSQLGLTWSFFHFYSLLPVFIGFASRHPFFSETSLEFLLIPFPLSRCPYFLSNAKRLSPSSTLLPVSLVLHTCTISSF